jgi:hypothetical protein
MRKISRTAIYILFCVLLTFFLWGCLTTQGIDNIASIAGTRWEYPDEEWSYEIEFGVNGRLITTHPNDTTLDNDYWEQEGNIVRFSFNNFYSEYEGEILTEDKIKGVAHNVKEESWDFQLIRIDD